MIRNWINRALRMVTTVSPSKTLVPLPAVIVGAAVDEAGNMLVDGSGDPIISSGTNAVLSAIYALAAKVDTMSGTVAQVEADIAALVAANTATQESLASIQTIVANMQAGVVLPAADLAALQAAVAGAQTNATTAHAIATSTSTATATQTATASST